MPDEILKFDGTSLNDIAHDLRRAATMFRLETDLTLLKAGTELELAAKAIAGKHSKVVAETIKLRAVPGMVIISVGDEATPIAALWELGNEGTKDTAKVQGIFFRHPVFGNKDVWVNQSRWPMLRPAQQAMQLTIKKMMNDTYDRVLNPYRITTEEGL